MRVKAFEGVAGHEQALQVWISCMHPFIEPNTVHARKAHISEKQADSLRVMFEGTFGIRCRAHPVSIFLKQHLKELHNIRFVFNQENDLSLLDSRVRYLIFGRCCC